MFYDQIAFSNISRSTVGVASCCAYFRTMELKVLFIMTCVAVAQCKCEHVIKTVHLFVTIVFT